jgi:hypothetical protein
MGVRGEPHAFLTIGWRVRITPGPLADHKSTLVRRKLDSLVVLSNRPRQAMNDRRCGRRRHRTGAWSHPVINERRVTESRSYDLRRAGSNQRQYLTIFRRAKTSKDKIWIV